MLKPKNKKTKKVSRQIFSSKMAPTNRSTNSVGDNLKKKFWRNTFFIFGFATFFKPQIVARKNPLNKKKTNKFTRFYRQNTVLKGIAPAQLARLAAQYWPSRTRCSSVAAPVL